LAFDRRPGKPIATDCGKYVFRPGRYGLDAGICGAMQDGFDGLCAESNRGAKLMYHSLMSARSNDQKNTAPAIPSAKPASNPKTKPLSAAKPTPKTGAKKDAKPGSKVAPVLYPGGKQSGGKAKVISSKLAYKGKVFNVYTDTVIEPTGHKNTRDVIRHNGSVVILAVDESMNPADPDVILERQYRHAAGQFLVELPAGRIEPGEAPLAAAKREMIEETGFRAKRWTLLTKYFASPGFLGEWMQIYLARDIREGESKPELDEQIEVRRVPLSKALEMMAANQIHDGKTLIGLSLYDAARRAGSL
jgi:ADP-ribose pyrophosphatase